MAKRKKIGDYFTIPSNDGYFYFGRIISNISCIFFDIRSVEKNISISELKSSSILFAVLCHRSSFKEGKWEILGHEELEEWLKKTPNYFHPNLFNMEIYHQTRECVLETAKYKTFINGGLQEGGMYSADLILERLQCYFSNTDFYEITNFLYMLDKNYNRK